MAHGASEGADCGIAGGADCFPVRRMDPVGGSETVVASHIEESVLVSVVARRPVSPTALCRLPHRARAKSVFARLGVAGRVQFPAGQAAAAHGCTGPAQAGFRWPHMRAAHSDGVTTRATARLSSPRPFLTSPCTCSCPRTSMKIALAPESEPARSSLSQPAAGAEKWRRRAHSCAHTHRAAAVRARARAPRPDARARALRPRPSPRP